GSKARKSCRRPNAVKTRGGSYETEHLLARKRNCRAAGAWRLAPGLRAGVERTCRQVPFLRGSGSDYGCLPESAGRYDDGGSGWLCRSALVARAATQAECSRGAPGEATAWRTGLRLVDQPCSCIGVPGLPGAAWTALALMAGATAPGAGTSRGSAVARGDLRFRLEPLFVDSDAGHTGSA